MALTSVGRGARVSLPVSSKSDTARIGPNAIIQTLRALDELESVSVGAAVRAQAKLVDTAPTEMIPEAWFVRLIEVLRTTLPASRAEAVLARAGRYTGEYVRARRIPRAVRVALGVLPARVGLPLLFSAFRRNAWTFAGAGAFSLDASAGQFPPHLVLIGAPTCRRRAAHDVVGRTGGYYASAFEVLVQLAAPDAHVREVACEADGDSACRFELRLSPLSFSTVAIPCVFS
jgi:divinyl protochlorophyllide a 8-vinyl-reductase